MQHHDVAQPNHKEILHTIFRYGVHCKNPNSICQATSKSLTINIPWQLKILLEFPTFHQTNSIFMLHIVMPILPKKNATIFAWRCTPWKINLSKVIVQATIWSYKFTIFSLPSHFGVHYDSMSTKKYYNSPFSPRKIRFPLVRWITYTNQAMYTLSIDTLQLFTSRCHIYLAIVVWHHRLKKVRQSLYT